MLINLNSCNKHKAMIEITIATFLFILAFIYNTVHYEPSFPLYIGYMLIYMVFLELTRAVVDFIVESDHRLKVKFIYDAGIIFSAREILVASTLNHGHIEKELLYIGVMMTIIIVFAILRYVDFVLNPKECTDITLNKKCDKK